MADTLKSLILFTAVAPGQIVIRPHRLSLQSQALKPDEVKCCTEGSFEVQDIGTDTIGIALKNVGVTTADCQCLCEAWHPIERHFGITNGDGSFAVRLEPQTYAPKAYPSSGDSFTVPNITGGLVKAGTPMTAAGALGNALLLGTSVIIGLALQAADTAMPIPMRSGGKITLDAGQWDLVTQQTGGLTANATYFLGAVAGTLSVSAPTAGGRSVVAIGAALTTTTMIIEIAQPILLA